MEKRAKRDDNQGYYNTGKGFVNNNKYDFISKSKF